MEIHASRVTATAALDWDRGRVEIGGQVFGADGRPLAGVTVVIRAAWGTECTATSAVLGSFGARFTAPADAQGQEIAIEADGVTRRLTVA